VLAAFWDYGAKGFPLPDETVPSVCDAALTAYANEMATNCEAVGEGEFLKAAWDAMYPDYSSRGTLRLPNLARALRGWAKLFPKSRRPKMAEVLADAIIGDLCEHQQTETALWVALAVTAYLRPCENHSLRTDCVVAPGKSSSFVSLIISPLELGIPSKNNKFDEAVLLDDSRMDWVGPAMLQWARHRRKTNQNTDTNLWTLPARLIWENVKASAARLDLLDIVTTLYCFRHVGPSRDQLLGLRTLVDIQRRGRWNHLSSVKHYEGHGRIQQTENRHAAAALRGSLARSHFPAIFQGSWS
jgi:hypothetical protein